MWTPQRKRELGSVKCFLPEVGEAAFTCQMCAWQVLGGAVVPGVAKGWWLVQRQWPGAGNCGLAPSFAWALGQGTALSCRIFPAWSGRRFQ